MHESGLRLGCATLGLIVAAGFYAFTKGRESEHAGEQQRELVTSG
jgi:hypothetical protein